MWNVLPEVYYCVNPPSNPSPSEIWMTKRDFTHAFITWCMPSWVFIDSPVWLLRRFISILDSCTVRFSVCYHDYPCILQFGCCEDSSCLQPAIQCTWEFLCFSFPISHSQLDLRWKDAKNNSVIVRLFLPHSACFCWYA